MKYVNGTNREVTWVCSIDKVGEELREKGMKIGFFRLYCGYLRVPG